MPTQSWKQFIQVNVDKIVLFFVFDVLLIEILYMAHGNVDQSLLSWLREQAGVVLGALLALVTGAVVKSSSTPAPVVPLSPQTENQKESPQ